LYLVGCCCYALFVFQSPVLQVLFPSSYASTARHVLPMSGAAADLLTRCQASLQATAAADASFQALAGGLQLLSRTKSLYSIMRKLLRLNDPAAGSRRLGQMYDLLGMRAVVLPRKDLPEAEAEAAAVQACYRLQVSFG
jgi:(p)ppGpp synthase/HD superfamily hydrolase